MIWLLIYIFFSLTSYLYVKHQEHYPNKIKYIAVLSASLWNVTQQRLFVALKLLKKYPQAQIIISGKEMIPNMKLFLQKSHVDKINITCESTNTFQDAVEIKKIIGNCNNVAIITHASHLPRVRHTFTKLFSVQPFYYSVSPFFSIDSILLPTGWVFSFINLAKDIIYNKKTKSDY